MITTTEAAEVAAVAPSTIKRWADQGILPFSLTAGGHRRFERFVVERLLREQPVAVLSGDLLASAWVRCLVDGRRLPGLLGGRRESKMSAPSRFMKRVVGLVSGLAMSAGCATSTTERLHLPPLQTVAHVDLSRYVGTWHEIANFPQSFQRGCTATTATYTLRADGDIDVLNRCRKGSLVGKEKSALGRAHVVDRATNAKLEVSFFRPFWGDYWIIDLADDYSYAVVGHPGRDYLWILARAPTMAEATFQGIVARLQAGGYQTSRLVRTLQGAGPGADASSARPRERS